MLFHRGRQLPNSVVLWHTPLGCCRVLRVPLAWAFSVVIAVWMLHAYDSPPPPPFWFIWCSSFHRLCKKPWHRLPHDDRAQGFHFIIKMSGISPVFLFDVPFKVFGEYWSPVWRACWKFRLFKRNVKYLNTDCLCSERLSWQKIALK